ncbi:hypothetical protein V6C03_09805 [Methyloligella sp. 2.7D]|uniref:RipA family octameric membrane protein n=1 Tax=unclassified Methyloligella TaxID=2625955 RepID=UPI00157D180F|nr:hypothetical protein [Methyloligella sp. GL2]QKP77860.1 hypothetical protein HT051_10650 [Methyloligella sp. GL2]
MSESESAERKKKEKILEIAADTRKFEIDLFWKRSLFFWGFIAAAFLAYGALGSRPQDDAVLLLTISSFGFVCSVAWTLANRGSKYWQMAWEAKLETYEDVLVKGLFTEAITPREDDAHWWGVLSRKSHYSVSRLAIALSDFTVLIWIILGARALPGIEWPHIHAAILIPIGALLYAVGMVIGSRSRNRAS